MTAEQTRKAALAASQEAQARAKRENDAITVLDVLLQAKRWHQGDHWREGSPAQRAAWEDHMNALNGAIETATGDTP